MPMKLSIGLSRKVGQPHFGSLGASCAVELEIGLDGSALCDDPAEFHRRVRIAYAACDRAVREELDRQQVDRPDDASGGPDRRDGLSLPTRWLATAAQVRALGKLAGRSGLDLDALAGERFGVDGPEELS